MVNSGEILEKQCSGPCKQVLPISEFGKRANRLCRSRCKECMALAEAARRRQRKKKAEPLKMCTRCGNEPGRGSKGLCSPCGNAYVNQRHLEMAFRNSSGTYFVKHSTFRCMWCDKQLVWSGPCYSCVTGRPRQLFRDEERRAWSVWLTIWQMVAA